MLLERRDPWVPLVCRDLLDHKGLSEALVNSVQRVPLVCKVQLGR